jgi:hypothetical protein
MSCTIGHTSFEEVVDDTGPDGREVNQFSFASFLFDVLGTIQ